VGGGGGGGGGWGGGDAATNVQVYHYTSPFTAFALLALKRNNYLTISKPMPTTTYTIEDLVKLNINMFVIDVGDRSRSP